MSVIFVEILNLSLSAGFVASVIILIRLLMKKAPKKYSYALWAVVFFRLICPFTLELPVNAVPVQPLTIPRSIIYNNETAAVQSNESAINNDVPTVDNAATTIDSAIKTFDTANVKPSSPVNPVTSATPVQIALEIGTYVWLTGALALLLYGAISYLQLKKKVCTAIRTYDNIYETDQINTPFTLGFIRPKIYLPVGINEKQLQYIIEHEKKHIKRRDYLTKPLAFLVASIHWFNPLAWTSYILMARDMELSVDEYVMKSSEEDIRGEYSYSLLSLSVRKSRLISPLAFGETGVKQRVKNVLSYKKPAFWVSLCAIVVVITASLLLMSSNAGGINAEKANAEEENVVGADVAGADAEGANAVGTDVGDADVEGIDIGDTNVDGINVNSTYEQADTPSDDQRIYGDLISIADKVAEINQKSRQTIIYNDEVLEKLPSYSLRELFEFYYSSDGAFSEGGIYYLTERFIADSYGFLSALAEMDNDMQMLIAYYLGMHMKADETSGYEDNVRKAENHGLNEQQMSLLSIVKAGYESYNITYPASTASDLAKELQEQLILYLSDLFTEAYKPHYEGLHYNMQQYEQSISGDNYVSTFLWTMYHLGNGLDAPSDYGKEEESNWFLQVTAKITAEGKLDMTSATILHDDSFEGPPTYQVPITNFFPPKPATPPVDKENVRDYIQLYLKRITDGDTAELARFLLIDGGVTDEYVKIAKRVIEYYTPYDLRRATVQRVYYNEVEVNKQYTKKQYFILVRDGQGEMFRVNADYGDGLVGIDVDMFR